MPLFDDNDFAMPTAERPVARKDAGEKAEAKAENIRGMSGYSSIDDVARNAPTFETETQQAGTPAMSGARKPTRKQVSDQLAEQERRRKIDEERRQKAMQVVGERLMVGLANAPYEVWAMLAADPMLRLNPDEQKELADAYMILAQAYEPDFSKPIYLIPTIMLMHARIGLTRTAYLAAKKAGANVTPADVGAAMKDMADKASGKKAN